MDYQESMDFIALCKNGKNGIQQAKQLGTDEIPKGNWCVFDALLDEGVQYQKRRKGGDGILNDCMSRGKRQRQRRQRTRRHLRPLQAGEAEGLLITSKVESIGLSL